ncbi:MAG: adenylosuccinate synthase [Candidatus Atribacteria bacterium]|nr:MAG: adenylosuccinate synthase [Candidatus Atribacteria bacterium]
MSTLVVVGSQWGDEGKGKITDLLAEEADIIVRYQGGCNAGHTVIKGDEQYIFHLIPSGILHEGVKCLIGNGVVIDPQSLLQEIESLKKKNIIIDDNLFIDFKAHVVLPYQKTLDEIKETKRGKDKIGTTKRGIGPAYTDKITRTGIRMIDLVDEKSLSKKLEINLNEKNDIFERLYGLKISNQKKKDIIKKYTKYGQLLKKYVIDVSLYLNQAINDDKKILFEGAQGTLLDVDHGTFPYVTSSNPTAGGACVGTGVGPTKIDRVMGITKAYTTRVGRGPFPTELKKQLGEYIRQKGGEFGATTGRPRRCGWFDAVIVSYAVRINGMNSMVLTKIDVLSDFEKIKICTSYKYNEETIREFPGNLEILQNCIPIYEEMEGWKGDISQITKYECLPSKVKAYISRIEELVRTKVVIVSVGPKRSQTIIREKVFK